MSQIASILKELEKIFSMYSSDLTSLDQNFVKDQILDSFSIISFITEVENSFGVTLSSSDLISEEAHSLAGLSNIIFLKLKG